MCKNALYQFGRAKLFGILLFALLILSPGSFSIANAQDGPEMPPNDTRSRPATVISRQAAVERYSALAPVPTYAPGYYDTSVYMLGKVAVGIVLPESVGNAENWTPARQNEVTNEIQAGLDWWKTTGGTLANLSFEYDVQLGIPTNYEPISRPSSDDALWISQTLSNLGYTSGDYWDKVYAYNNHLRDQYQTDWAFTIFVVDSYNDSDGMFTDGYFAYAYIGGPFMVMTYDNDGWGINNMDRVAAHEIGHIFMAGDQYGSCSTTRKYGYLGVVNGNCNGTSSIMRDNSLVLDSFARRQIGWQDSDFDSIPDILDIVPTVTLASFSPNPTSNSILSYNGYVNNPAYPHAVCSEGDWCYSKDVTTQSISKVNYQVDSGQWKLATAQDGSFDSDAEDFYFGTGSLTSGQHTIKLTSENISGTVSSTWNDSVTVSAPAAAVGPGKVDDTDLSWTYTGNWSTYTGPGPYNNTIHFSGTIGSYAELDFQGNQFKLNYTGFTDRGVLDVYVDNVKVGTLNEYNSSLAWQSTWTSPHVIDTTHTLKLEHISGTYVDIDAVEILQVTPLSPGIYNDTNNAWHYNGNWLAYAGAGPYNNSMHFSSTIGNYATLVFQGNHFILTHSSYSNFGQLQVYIDDNLEGTLDEYYPTLIWQNPAPGPVVTNDTHVLKLVHATGAYVDIEAIKILQVTPLDPGTYDDADAAWTYSGNWLTYAGSGPYNNTLHYSNTIGNYASLVFRGSQFNLTHTGYTNRGQVQVYVDGNLEGTLDEFNSTLFWQRTVSSPSVADDTHLLKLVHSAGAFVDIDAIQIIGLPESTPPAAIDDLVATPGVSIGSVDLSWTAVGDDGTIGTATTYLVRFSPNPINDESSWNLATPVSIGSIPTPPKPAGQIETMTVTNIDLTAGNTYYFAVRAQDEVPNTSSVSTNIANSSAQAFAPPPPPNDNFSNATEITSMPFTESTDYLTAATTEESDPAIVQCNTDQGLNSIWYSYTPGADGILTLDTFGSVQFDTLLAVWTYNGGTFTHVSCNDDATENASLQSAIATYVYGGTTYYIEIVQFGQAPQSSPGATSPLAAPPIDNVILNANFSPATLKGLGKFDDTDSGWVYSNNWLTYNGPGPYNNTMHFSGTIGSYAALAFQGSRQFKLTYNGFSNRGRLDVYIDNVKVGALNEYSPSLAWQSTWTSSHYTDTIHTIKLVHASGAYVDIDAIEILQVTPLIPGIYDDMNNAWAYSGNWFTYNGPGPYNNTLHYSDTIGSFATLVFQGSQIILTHTGYPNRGQLLVYIDGNLEGALNEFNATLLWQKTTNGPSVAENTHILKLFHATGDFVDIDAIQIIGPPDTTTPSAINTLSASKGSVGGSVNLSWTAVGDDGTTGTATAYLVRYSTSVINDLTSWNNATPYPNSLIPKAAGQTENLTVYGLTPSQPYYFAVRAQDEVPNTGPVSGSPPSPVQPDPITPLGLGKYDDANPGWTYVGTWLTYAGPGPYSNTLHFSSTIGNYAIMAFQGNQFKLTYTGNPDRGNLDVYVDNVKVGTLNQYNLSLAWQRNWAGPHVTNTTHTLKLEHASGAYVDIDAIEILQVTPLSSGLYDDMNSAWHYEGTWLTYNGPGPYNNTMHYSNIIGNYATLVFQGNQFILTHAGNTDRGQVQVYVDGSLAGTLDEFNPTLLWQKTTNGPTVTNGAHVLKLVHSTGTYIDIDAIQIITP